MLSSIILAIVGKIICVKLDYLFSLFSEAFRLAQGIFFRHAKELEGKKTNRKRKYALYARHIEEDFLKSIHDAQFGICHATGTFAENIRSGKDDGRNEMAISATT